MTFSLFKRFLSFSDASFLWYENTLFVMQTSDNLLPDKEFRAEDRRGREK